jgi:hypothetical protein
MLRNDALAAKSVAVNFESFTAQKLRVGEDLPYADEYGLAYLQR